jgi:hypothetical protein
VLREADDIQVDPTGEGILIQVDRVGSSPSGADDANDFLRKIGGVGILMRSKSAADWRCLNMAIPEVLVSRASGIWPGPASRGLPLSECRRLFA